MTSQPAPSHEPSEIKPVPLFDTQRQYAAIAEQAQAAIARVCASGRFVLGPECEEFEKAAAEYCGAKHALGCASGSDALLLALMAYDIGPGHEVICPSYTFFATASAVARLGARPVFVDIDPVTYNILPSAIAAAITPATRAILPVHLYGQCAEMDEINAIAAKHGLPVIEDAAQAIGAEFHGRRAGVLGDIACFSFYPTKNLGGFGDGGMMTTNNDELAHKLRLLRVHGMGQRYYHQLIGINSRLDTIQAAILALKLPYLDDWTARRTAHAARYAELFARYKLDRVLTLPVAQPNKRHVWNQYIVRVSGGRRDALRAYLAERKIGSEIYYPVPLHMQECFRYLDCSAGSLPETERAAAETMALPIFPELTAEEQETVVAAIAAFFGVGVGSPLTGPRFHSANATSSTPVAQS